MAFNQFVMDAIRSSLDGKIFLVDIPFSEKKHSKIAALFDYCTLQLTYLAKFDYDVGQHLRTVCMQAYDAITGNEEASLLRKTAKTIEETATLLETAQPLIANNERSKLLRDFIRDFQNGYLEDKL